MVPCRFVPHQTALAFKVWLRGGYELGRCKIPSAPSPGACCFCTRNADAAANIRPGTHDVPIAMLQIDTRQYP